jgi:hypothetical protein
MLASIAHFFSKVEESIRLVIATRNTTLFLWQLRSSKDSDAELLTRDTSVIT